MEPRDVLARIMGLFSAEELRGIAKQVDVKGSSKLTKGELIKAIVGTSPSDMIGQLVEGEGKRKIQETIKGAFSMIEGVSVSGEHLDRVTIDADRVDATFDGIRWSTRCTGTISRSADPEWEFSCTCKVAEAGSLCIHYWVVAMHLLIDSKLSASNFIPFSEMASDIIDAGVKRASARKTRARAPRVDVKGKSLPELLQAWTDAGRYDRALEELGKGVHPTPEGRSRVTKPAKPSKLAEHATSPIPEQSTSPGKPETPAKQGTRPRAGRAGIEPEGATSGLVTSPAAEKKPAAPRVKKARESKEGKPPKENKPLAEPYRVQVDFLEAKPGPPARYHAIVSKLTSAGKVRLPFHMLVDEGEKVIAHDGCMDFDMRLRKKQLLCKHLLQTFMGMEEHVATRILAQLGTFEFRSVVPRTRQTQLELPASVRSMQPDVHVADEDALKERIMDYLFANEHDPEKLSIDAIVANIGSGAKKVLDVLLTEHMVDEFKPNHFTAK